ncbi:DUF983 domain-containing protein [Pararhodobacter sp. SW119]|uniref:DUF983 domain-containing protein n=1 Tax=Pararhodobacter sp. SW119 TaxID=2780075 RepID=UPI001ADF4616|nr:DUF983 domain-containing protein [Pararhodobacter sp. SW119]
MNTSANETNTAERATKLAVLKGLRGRCPACGEGKLFARYLKVTDACSVCGEELHHHRADDGPAFLTILIVGKLVAIVFPLFFGLMMDEPLMVALGLCAAATALALLVLPRMKGLMVGFQWAKRMHGFGRPAT